MIIIRPLKRVLEPNMPIEHPSKRDKERALAESKVFLCLIHYRPFVNHKFSFMKQRLQGSLSTIFHLLPWHLEGRRFWPTNGRNILILLFGTVSIKCDMLIHSMAPIVCLGSALQL